MCVKADTYNERMCDEETANVAEERRLQPVDRLQWTEPIQINKHTQT